MTIYNNAYCTLYTVYYIRHEIFFYLKMCVNYNKSNSWENSVKGPNDPNGAKNADK